MRGARVLSVMATALGVGLAFAALYTAQAAVSGFLVGDPLDDGFGLLRRYALIWETRALLGGGIFLGWPLLGFERRTAPGRVVVVASGALAYAAVQSAMVVGIRAAWPELAPETVVHATNGLAHAYLVRVTDTAAPNVIAFLVVSLFSSLVHTEREMRFHRAREAELAADLANAELRTLRAQLQPHFLFNTLHTVTALMSENVDRARQVMASLGDLLRTSLDGTTDGFVSLDRELAFTDAYLDIQRARYESRLQTVRDVSESARHAMVPAMILQPLFENAIRHGIESTPGPGRIDLRCHVVEGRLRLEVTNTGRGMTQAGHGVGLANLRSRLSLLYGALAELEANPSPSGFEVSVSLPFSTSPPFASGADAAAGASS